MVTVKVKQKGITIDAEEYFVKEAYSSGNGAAVTVPKKYVGRKVYIVVPEKKNRGRK